LSVRSPAPRRPRTTGCIACPKCRGVGGKVEAGSVEVVDATQAAVKTKVVLPIIYKP
jgi:excinuclease UvrABC ATPase subunit